MRKEIIETGKTVDAAIDRACEKLGCNRDDCQWEIVDLPRKGFLGLKKYPAKVRVSIEVPEEKAPVRKPEPPAPAKKVSQPSAPQGVKAAQPAAKKERPPVQREPSRPAPSPKVVMEDREEQRVAVTQDFNEKEVLAMDYIRSIVRDFGLEAVLELSREASGVYINITGEGMGTIIGRRGETLDALQYLTGLVANRLEGDYLRINVDCGDYRTKRKETLDALAKKLASQVLKTNVSKALEPMNPFERRVIHAAVSKIEGVSSSSIGEEPNRRVIITSPTARKAVPSRSYSGSRDSRDRDHERRDSRGPREGSRDRERDRRDGPRKPATRAPRPAETLPTGPPKETPESSAMEGTPIGKLDLE